MEETRIDILLNNTVLSNFGLVNQMKLLQQAVRNRAATTKAVLREFHQGIELGYLPSISMDWLVILELDEEEKAIFQLLNQRYGAGEASCLAVAQKRGMKFVTDDRDARRYAQRLGIPVSGTIGILVDLIRLKVLSLQEANSILREMIHSGYHSPLEDLSVLV